MSEFEDFSKPMFRGISAPFQDGFAENLEKEQQEQEQDQKKEDTFEREFESIKYS